MKTLNPALIVLILISFSAIAQTPLKIRTDSLVLKNDSIQFNQKINPLLNYPFGTKKDGLILPGHKPFKQNPNLAFIPNHKPQVYADPNFRMPVLKPRHQWNMPAMKPDTSIQYFIRIMPVKKIIR